MTTSRWFLVLAAVGVMAGVARAGEEGYLVKLTGMDRKAEWVTMSEVEFKALEKNLKLEKALFPKAIEAVGKEWRADELNKGIAYPGSRLVPRSVATAQPFASLEKAEAQLSRIEDQEAKKLERQYEKDKKSGKSGKAKSKTMDEKEVELLRAADAVKAKLSELVAKAGGDTNAPAFEAKAEAKLDEKEAKAEKEKGGKVEKVEKAAKHGKGEAKAAAAP